MTILLSDIYDVTLKRDNRGANKFGWIRPTVGECFVTHKDFNLIQASYGLPETLGFFDIISTNAGALKGTYYKNSVNILTRGKYYLEQNALVIEDPVSMRVEISNANTGSLLANPIAYTRAGSTFDFILHQGDVMGIAIDVDNGEVDVYENGLLRGNHVWDGGQPLKLSAVLEDHGTQSIPTTCRAQINPGPNFSYNVPSGYKAFIDL